MNIAPLIREQVDIQNYAKNCGLNLNRNGFCKCWLHEDKTPSVKFYPDGKGFYCFSCHKGGDVIDFAESFFGLSFAEACQKINEDCNLGLPIGGKRPTIRQYRKVQHIRSARQRREETLNSLTQEYESALSEWSRLDRWSRDYAPKNPGDAFDPRFCEAMTGLQSASERLSAAQIALYDFEGGEAKK